MAKSYAQNLNPGAFIATTSVFDVAQLSSVAVTSPEFKNLIVRLYQNVNNIALLLNLKDTGYYVEQEFINGQVFFPNPALNSLMQQAPTYRQVYRMVVDFGALPNTATKTVAHNIPNIATVDFTFTRIYGAASDTTGKTFIPLPYASNTAGASIELSVDATNVIITTGSNRTNYNVCYVVLEYIKQ